MGLSDYLPDSVKDEAVRIAKSAADGMKSGGFAGAAGKVANTGVGDFTDAIKTKMAGSVDSVVSPVMQFVKTAFTGDATPPFSGGATPTFGRNVPVAGETPPKFVPSSGPLSVPDSSGNAAPTAAPGIAPYQSALTVRNSIGSDGNPLRTITGNGGPRPEPTWSPEQAASVRAAAYAPTSYAPPPVPTPTTIPGVVDNDGSWSTRIANHNARKDYAAIQAANAANIHANASATNASTGAFNANTAATRSAAENALTRATATGAGVKQYGEALDNAKKLRLSELHAKYLAAKTDKEREDIQLQMLAIDGKDTTQDKYQQIQTLVGYQYNPLTNKEDLPLYKTGLFNTRTREFVEPKTATGAKSPYPEGTEVKGKDGKTYVVKNGQPAPK